MSAFLTILGFNSAIPTVTSSPTAQVLEMAERHFLIDCGEGTQVQLRKAKAKFSKINHIFISHLHGDHCFGLPGLISSFQLLGRETPLHIYGPAGIQELIETVLRLTETNKGFELVFHELKGKESVLVFEDSKVEVYTIPLNHRIYCNGYLFKEKPKERHLNMNEIAKYPEIEICDYHNIKRGKDFVLNDGYILKNEMLTTPPEVSVSYAFCSDTLYFEALAEEIKGARVVYHEATFLKNNEELAAKTMHSTAYQAGLTAKNANAEVLILGHYSSRYNDIKLFKEEASEVFANVYLAEDGKKFVYQ